jgi:hypothetical protein
MELIFEVRDPEEGGYCARALGHAIFTEAETWEELRATCLRPPRCILKTAKRGRFRCFTMQMTHTRYSATKIILLVAGALIALFNTFLVVMTAGFGADPVHDFRSFAAACLLDLALLSAPLYLIALRWSGVSCVGTWGVTCALITLVSG